MAFLLETAQNLVRSESQYMAFCVADTYSEDGWTQCESCPEGYSCADAASAPVICNPGEFSADGGQ